MTSVTLENRRDLDHHVLAGIRISQRGKSYIALIVRPDEKHPLIGCSVTIYDKTGEKILVQVDPTIGQAKKLEGLPDGSRVYFHVADELVDSVRIMYHLHATGFKAHVFTIEKGMLGKLANFAADG